MLQASTFLNPKITKLHNSNETTKSPKIHPLFPASTTQQFNKISSKSIHPNQKRTRLYPKQKSTLTSIGYPTTETVQANHNLNFQNNSNPYATFSQQLSQNHKNPNQKPRNQSQRFQLYTENQTKNSPETKGWISSGSLSSWFSN